MATRFRGLVRKIREINQRYNKPHIEMSRGVKISLIALRVYLLLLVSLIVYKFILIIN
ncbi:hypothetical protein GALL_432590 [mine drainage metagenome]|uniref:Uncharacterized protein n=1 Tax=mine drainage metagenome TaxID=410659 RepID=A0A1J5Q5B0_9ZZZZ